MEIRDNTVKFKSNYYFYGLEKRGVKPNTLRILDRYDSLEVEEWRNKIFEGSRDKYIEIFSTPKDGRFRRRLTWCGKIEELFGKEIWMFCWKHPR